MKKTIKKFTATTLAGILAVVTSVPSAADNTQMITLDAFIDESLQTGMEMCDFQNGYYSISNLVPVYNFETNEVCNYKLFVLSDDKVVGEMDIWENENNNFISSFSKSSDETINMFVDSEDAICYGIYNGKMWLCANSETFYEIETDELTGDEEQADLLMSEKSVLSKTSNGNFYEMEIEDESKVPEKITVYSEPFVVSEAKAFKKKENFLISNSNLKNYNNTISQYNLRTTNDSIVLNVEHVQNDKADGSLEPNLCWAACIAMKTNYKNRDVSKYVKKSARSVYTDLKTNNMDVDGSVECVKNAYSRYGISVSGGSVIVLNSKLWKSLSADHPVDLAVKGYNSKGNKDFHQVLLTGMKKSDTGLSYRINCPNKETNSGTKIISISGDLDELLDSHLATIPYTDNWTYSNGVTIDFNNVYRTYYTA